MSAQAPGVDAGGRLQALRQGFDAAYAEAPAVAADAGDALLAISLGGEPYALRLSGISGLARDRRVVRLPQSPPAFAGFSGLRGQLLPVWDLAVLLGAPAAPALPWQVVVAGPAPWALAFERFDGCLTLGLAGFRPYAGKGRAAPFTRQTALGADGPRLVLELPLLEASVLAQTASDHGQRSK